MLLIGACINIHELCQKEFDWYAFDSFLWSTYYYNDRIDYMATTWLVAWTELGGNDSLLE